MPQLRGGHQLCPVGPAVVTCQVLGLGLVPMANLSGPSLPDIPSSHLLHQHGVVYGLDARMTFATPDLHITPDDCSSCYLQLHLLLDLVRRWHRCGARQTSPLPTWTSSSVTTPMLTFFSVLLLGWWNPWTWLLNFLLLLRLDRRWISYCLFLIRQPASLYIDSLTPKHCWPTSKLPACLQCHCQHHHLPFYHPHLHLM